MKTPEGYEPFGQYFLGNEKTYAEDIFSQMKGCSVISEHAKLHMDLIESVDGIPLTARTICCTLDEFACNCKHLAKEIFRLHTLKELF
ncbi:MAG TPA: hypothetical protein VJ844_09730 [Mucilaginibacter sp.]|nr:hypothetical protein [Mucilaginibacter sp.]